MTPNANSRSSASTNQPNVTVGEFGTRVSAFLYSSQTRDTGFGSVSSIRTDAPIPTNDRPGDSVLVGRSTGCDLVDVIVWWTFKYVARLEEISQKCQCAHLVFRMPVVSRKHLQFVEDVIRCERLSA
jgi:hypothetical protein